MTHPEELLAAYVDGSLVGREHAEVEAHLADCERCRAEVRAASRSREALRALPQLEAPATATWPVLRQARKRASRRRFQPTRLVAGLAAAAAVAGLIGIVISQGGGGGGTPSPIHAAASEAASDQARSLTSLGGFVHQNANYSHADISGLASRIEVLLQERNAADKAAAASGAAGKESTSAGASGAVGGGGAAEAAPSPSPAPAGQFQAALTSNPNKQALSCIARASGGPASRSPVQLIEAKFEGTPAYIGAFVETLGGSPTRELVIWVASKKDCTLLSFAQKSLP
jgi:hypothetical protein